MDFFTIVQWGWGGVGWLEKWGIKLSHLSTEVEVEVEDELGNFRSKLYR